MCWASEIKTVIQVDGQERKEELKEPQSQSPLSESKSIDVYHQHSDAHSGDLGWQVDRFHYESSISWTLRTLEESMWTAIIMVVGQEGETCRRYWLSLFLSVSEGMISIIITQWAEWSVLPRPHYAPPSKTKRKEGKKWERKAGRHSEEHYNEVKTRINNCKK